MENIENSREVEDFCKAVDMQLKLNKKRNEQVEKELIRRAEGKKRSEKLFEEKMKTMKMIKFMKMR